MNNFQYQVIFLGIVLLFIIFFSLSNIDPVPYSNQSVFTKVYPYTEGLTTEKTADLPAAFKNAAEKKTAAEGFQGLQSAPYGSETPIDIYSQLKSGKDCDPSPYSNSLGYLCLDENAKKMLLTRGGNQTYSESQIGTNHCSSSNCSKK